MYLSLIFFFTSLFGIIFMLSRKKVDHFAITEDDYLKPLPPLFYINWKEAKKRTAFFAKRFAYVTCFLTIRFSLKSASLFKNQTKKIFLQLLRQLQKNKNELNKEISEQKEISKYLKIISEYKKKMQKIKNRIKEEEGIE